MEIEGPPVRYPGPSAAPSDLYRAGDSTLGSSSTLGGTESTPSSPRQPPAYGDEGAPPQYQETTAAAASSANGKTKIAQLRRRTVCIRLMTSILITVIVSLIVAAVVSKIKYTQTHEKAGDDNTAGATESAGRVVTLNEANPTATGQKLADNTGTEAATTMTTAHITTMETPTTTQAPSTTERSPTTRATNDGLLTVNCPCLTGMVRATASPEENSYAAAACKPHQGSSEGPDQGDDLLGVSVYSLQECLVARASYKGLGDDFKYRCTVSCEEDRFQQAVATQVMLDDWKWAGQQEDEAD